MSMNKFWPKFLISQLFLVGGLINLVTAVMRHDFSPLSLEKCTAAFLWYIGLVLQLPDSSRRGAAYKLAGVAVFGGAMLKRRFSGSPPARG